MCFLTLREPPSRGIVWDSATIGFPLLASFLPLKTSGCGHCLSAAQGAESSQLMAVVAIPLGLLDRRPFKLLIRSRGFATLQTPFLMVTSITLHKLCTFLIWRDPGF